MIVKLFAMSELHVPPPLASAEAEKGPMRTSASASGPDRTTLLIMLRSAKGLLKADVFSNSDPYCVFSVVGDSQGDRVISKVCAATSSFFRTHPVCACVCVCV